MRTTIVAVSGLSSNVGKTTLVCDLLSRLPGWEAIKVSRGHYRSCGKDPGACCIAPMLGDRPVVLSGRQETYSAGKDTGRYWDSGASNVHWVICTSGQVEEGVRLALDRVASGGVLIEGTSFLRHVNADYSVVVTGSRIREIKASALRVIEQANSLYVAGAECGASLLDDLRKKLAERGARLGEKRLFMEQDIEALSQAIITANRQ